MLTNQESPTTTACQYGNFRGDVVYCLRQRNDVKLNQSINQSCFQTLSAVHSLRYLFLNSILSSSSCRWNTVTAGHFLYFCMQPISPKFARLYYEVNITWCSLLPMGTLEKACWILISGLSLYHLQGRMPLIHPPGLIWVNWIVIATF